MSALHALRWGAARIASGGAILLAILFPGGRLTSARAADDPPKALPSVELGHELFKHVWGQNDPRAKGGDGLGPVFNARSCLACHDQGGVGGGGSLESNVQVLAATGPWTQTKVKAMHPGLAHSRRVVLHLSGVGREYEKWRSRRLGFARFVPRQADANDEPDIDRRAPSAEEVFVAAFSQAAVQPITPVAMQIEQGFARQALALEAMQSGRILDPASLQVQPPGSPAPDARFRPRRTPVVAKVSPEPAHTIAGLAVSERNTTSLFGLGLIDGIPDAAIEAVAREEARSTPQSAGRVSRLADDRIGRFGWHAQQASLADFTLTACAVEIGLELPDHPQAGNPLKPNYRAPGYDMDAKDCAALVAYVAQLPRPTIADFGLLRSEKQKSARAGHTLFVKIGCADCHRETLGDVAGLYSDLLLHDMGSELKAGGYGAFAPHGEPTRDTAKQAAIARSRVVDLSVPREQDVLWRTPPLWGVASSAPYLHDGRAATLLDAVELHGGEGLRSAQLFSSLSAGEQDDLLVFMSMQIAPPSAEQIHRFNGGGGWGMTPGAQRSFANSKYGQSSGGCIMCGVGMR